MEDQIKEMLIRHEGLVCNPYKCSVDKLTIGVGRNLDANGISEEEALYLLDNDIKRVHEELDKNWGVWRTFPEQARMVCIDCCFQMGITGWMNFRRTRALMEMGCWLESSEEILDSSKYHIQLPRRSEDNARMLALCHKNPTNNLIKPSD